MYRSQKLSLRYFTAAIVLFGVMILFGLLSALYYLYPSMLFNVFNFSTSKILHIDTLVIWLLMAFMGAVYWYLPKELGREIEGMWLAEATFWVFCAVVAVVALVFVFVQYGSASEFSGRGVGMSSFRERVRALAGKLEVRSAKGIGTSWFVRFNWPVKPAHTAARIATH